MRFCLDLDHQSWRRAADPVAAARRTLAQAAAADVAGIDAIWVTEDPDGWDAFALLGAIAASTRQARLGPGVTTPLLRHPNLLAASTATLDRLSGGRAVLGLGRGQPEWYAGGLGMPADRALTRLAETIDLLRRWWAPPHRAASADGDLFAVRDWPRTVHPVQDAVPIYLAAAGPKALALAARTADGVIFNALTSREFLAEAIPTVRREAAAAGRDPVALAFVLRTAVAVTEDPAPVLRAQKNLLALVNTLPGMDRPIASEGFDVPALVAELRRLLRVDEALAAGRAFPDLRATADFAAARAAIPDALIERLAIAGDVAVVRARLAELSALGVTHVSVAPPADPSPAGWRRLLDALRG